MIFSFRSWYFVISFVLVRCGCQSAALESKDVGNLNSSEDERLPLRGLAKRNDLTGVTRLFRRAASNSDSEVFAILTGCVAGILILFVLFVFVWTRFKRHRVLDIEKGVVSLDKEVPSHALPSTPPSQFSFKSSKRSPKRSPNRSSWAFLELRFARRKLWASIAKESPRAHPYPFPDSNSATDPERYLSKTSLPFQHVPPLSKPDAALVPDQFSVAHLRASPTREKNLPLAVLLPVDGGVLSIPAALAPESDGDDIDTLSHRRQAQFAPAVVPHITTSLGGTGNAVVAQTIIANKQKPRPTESLSRSPTRSRKGSLLSGPPLTVHDDTPPSPTEGELIDVPSYYASAHPLSRNLEEELYKMLSEQSMVDSKEEIQRDQ